MIFLREPDQIQSSSSDRTARIMGIITVSMILLMGGLFIVAAVVRAFP
jgi:hypothetical protein